MDGRFRAGIIGCGGISSMHAGNYAGSRDADLVAAADLSENARTRFADQHPGVHVYASAEEMLGKESLDIVSVCTPPAFHFDPAMIAARSGIRGLLLEKPIALNLEDADTVIAECEKNGVTLAIGHQLRCAAPYQAARSLIAQGEIGTVERIWGLCHGAPLQTNATHTIDLICFLAGDAPVEWVLGNVDLGPGAMMEGFRQEVAAVGMFQFKDGPTAVIESGQLPPSRGYHHIYLDGLEGRIELSRPGGPDIRYSSTSTGGNWKTPAPAPALNPVDDLVDSVRTGRAPLASAKAGRAVLEIILGLLESARTHRRSDLPLATRENPLQQMYESAG